MITILIKNIDRTSNVIWPGLKIVDNINQKVNECSFKVRSYEGKTYHPDINDEIVILNGSNKIFAGDIVKVSREMESANVEVFSIKASDYTKRLRKIVTESYKSKSVDYIIDDLIDRYAPGFTINNVSCPIVLPSISFNNLSLSDCLEKISKRTNYFWYADYDKDIHFFSKAGEVAPFGVTDTNGNCITNSLKITEDVTQIRNRIRIRGNNVAGSPRSEYFDGDGSNTIFRLANKFAELPTVTVGGVTKTVGVDFLDQEDSFDCFWNYIEKYVRFKTTTAPASGSKNVIITGSPTNPIIVQAEDTRSIESLKTDSFDGIFEYYIKDETIKTVDEARQRALAELESYANTLNEGSFRTYTDGLKSGQKIRIQSDRRGMDDYYLIQSVSMSILTKDSFEYSVEIATMKTMGITYFLQNLLLKGKVETDEGENETLYKLMLDHQEVAIEENIQLQVDMQDTQSIVIDEYIVKDPFGEGVEPEWVLGPYVPQERDMLGKWNLTQDDGLNDLSGNENHHSLRVRAVRYLKMDGDARDSSLNEAYCSLYGTNPAEDRIGRTNGALSFGGVSTDYIGVGNIQLGNNYFISVWIKRDPNAAGWNTIFSGRSPYYNNLAYHADGRIGFGNFSSVWAAIGGAVLTDTDNWHHIVCAVTSDGTNGTWKLWVDGVYKGESGTVICDGNCSSAIIGKYANGSGTYFKGLMDEMVIATEFSSYKLSDSYFSNLYTLQLSHDLNHPIVNDGEFGTVYEFDGHLLMTKSAKILTLNSGVKGYTLAGWFLPKVHAEASAQWVGDGSNGDNSAANFGIAIGKNANAIGSWAGGICGSLVNAPTLADGNWHHIAIIYHQSSTWIPVSLYLDGAYIGQGSIGRSTPFSMSRNMVITANYSGYRTAYKGKISNLRLYERELSEYELGLLYQKMNSLAVTDNKREMRLGISSFLS